MEQSERRKAASWGALLGFVIGLGEAMVLPFAPIPTILATMLVGFAIGAMFGRRPVEAALRIAAWF